MNSKNAINPTAAELENLTTEAVRLELQVGIDPARTWRVVAEDKHLKKSPVCGFTDRETAIDTLQTAGFSSIDNLTIRGTGRWVRREVGEPSPTITRQQQAGRWLREHPDYIPMSREATDRFYMLVDGVYYAVPKLADGGVELDEFGGINWSEIDLGQIDNAEVATILALFPPVVDYDAEQTQRADQKDGGLR